MFAWLVLLAAATAAVSVSPWLPAVVGGAVLVLWAILHVSGAWSQPESAPLQRSVDGMIDSMHLVSHQAEKHWDELPHPVRRAVVAMRRDLARVDA